MKVRRSVASVAAVAVTVAAVVASGAGSAARANAATAGNRGTGIGTEAALRGPHCDPIAGNVAMPSSFIPPCVRPFRTGAPNGGATTRGVTATTVKVVVVTPNTAQELAFRSRGQGLPYNAGTAGPGTWEDAVRDMSAPWDRFLEQWGRTVQYVFLPSTGSDEPAQRADALAVIGERPFAAIVIPGGTVLQTQLAAARILVLGTSSITEALAQTPYRWGAFSVDVAAAGVNTGEFVAKSLDRRPAKWAGDESLRRRTRQFATVHPRPTATNDFRIEYFTDVFRKYARTGSGPSGARRVVLPTSVPFDSASSLTAASAEYALQAPLLVSKLKESGSTTVILFADWNLTRELLGAATAQDFRPEWVITAYSLLDVNILARGFDQSQWAHAFGVGGQLPPVVTPTREPNAGVYGWYWGQREGTTSPILPGHVTFLFTGIHMAGPRLTAKSFRAGMFAMPRVGGAADGRVTSYELAFGPAAGLPYDEYLAIGLDATLVWWSPDTALPANASGTIAFPGTGTYYYVNGAKRFQSGTWPKGLPRFFDTAASTAALDPLPASDEFPDYPCDGCPSDAGG